MKNDQESRWLRLLSKCLRVAFEPGIQVTMDTTPHLPIEVATPARPGRLEFCDGKGARYVADLPAKSRDDR